MDYQAEYDRIWRIVIDKVRALNTTESLEKIGRRMGVNRATISRWLNELRGNQRVSFKDMLQYLDALDISLADLFQGIIPNPGEFDFVPKVKARVSAGTGSLETASEIRGLYAFRKDFLARIGDRRNLVIFDVTGDSMEPTVTHGDSVLINRAETSPGLGDICAVRIDDEIVLKRILKEPGRLILKSDNPAYAPVSIDVTQDNPNFEVIGRARWLARTF